MTAGQFALEKQILRGYYNTTEGIRNATGIYTLLGNEQTPGRLVTSKLETAILFAGRRYLVTQKGNWSAKRQYFFTDTENGAQVAEAEWENGRKGPKTLFTLHTQGDGVYLFSRLRVGPLFGRRNRNRVHCSLQNEHCELIYKVKIDLPFFFLGTSAEYPLKGCVEFTGTDNLFLVFAGLFLMEEYFRDYESD